MKHLGDITKLNGAKIPVVDVITGGSPCQDLSVAGLRKGLKHEESGDEETTRSGLFMDQLRIIKEMRASEICNGRTGIHVRPRFMVWENVPGAFSSNGGKDFQTVLTEIVRVVCPDAPDVPLPDRGGWQHSGILYDGVAGRWSIAYRLHDAQHFGVPQRRKRIALVADFNGLAAPEILFDPQLRGETEDSKPDEAVRDSGARRGPEIPPVPDGLQGNPDAGGTAGQGASEGPAGRADGASGLSFQERAGGPGGARESSCRMSEQGPCQPSTTNLSSPDDEFRSECSRFYDEVYGWPDEEAFSIQGNTIDRTPKQNGGGGYLPESGAHAEQHGPSCGLRGGGLPERDGKPFCERDPASEGAGDKPQQQQRCEGPETIAPPPLNASRTPASAGGTKAKRRKHSERPAAGTTPRPTSCYPPRKR